MEKLIVFRVDATPSLGVGHVRRCMAVADSMQTEGPILFLCRWVTPAIREELTNSGYVVLQIEGSGKSQDKLLDDEIGWVRINWYDDVKQCKKMLAGWGKADLLVVDHYGLDARWERAMKNSADLVLAIDDLADRRHDTQMLLDQTPKRSITDYVNLVPEECLVLCGVEYALVNNRIYRLRTLAENRRNKIKSPRNLLVSLGGTDPTNLNSVVLDAISKLPFRSELKVNVALTSSAPKLEKLRETVVRLDYDVKLCVDVVDMGALMLNADLAIGACGGSIWERAVLGLPTISLVSATNQYKIAEIVQNSGAVMLLNTTTTPVTPSMIGEAISSIWEDPSILYKMSLAAFRLCDGLGTLRLVEEMAARECRKRAEKDFLEIQVRNAIGSDEFNVYMWQGGVGSRLFARNTNVPMLQEHKEWFRNTLCDPNRRLNIIEYEGVPAGIIRLDSMNNKSVFEVSILVSKPFQKLGLGRHALNLTKQIKDVQELRAYVKQDNCASRKLFVGAGFVRESDDWYVWRRRSISTMSIS
ncbi:MAG: UDP-2,4-diacetamido-2,4,6-trideoxy-beta-L-altropyranose hydrolase [Proteobacteria bacterium]|nr:UDP-2,4-diacetamido-2,4,6-trideoxy-beta-L-altropyranose hydrolase [Pseudomonadota bacterium]MBU1738782.1 UDP-2,4-diacetamido-2,4,6-trideoxy-beta-L-altropyranose hydrolase [Pseudomonadota bacterium]